MDCWKETLYQGAPPSTIRTTYGDHERCRTNYFAARLWKLYFTGDGALKDAEGNYRITGPCRRCVLNVPWTPHRNCRSGRMRSICMPVWWKARWWAIRTISKDRAFMHLLFIIIFTAMKTSPGRISCKRSRTDHRTDCQTRQDPVCQRVAKTRSGKIMRRILRKIAEGEMANPVIPTTLLDPGVVEEIKNGKTVSSKTMPLLTKNATAS